MYIIKKQLICFYYNYNFNLTNKESDKEWKPSSLTELTPIIFNMELTHWGSEVSKYKKTFICAQRIKFCIYKKHRYIVKHF